ncbi:hypothetical protein KHQ88_02765 [Mycoplasmatota bacterium]|nr:hypothetical protein KHQ88_02765 [Mycoplasmatota bacterium]
MLKKYSKSLPLLTIVFAILIALMMIFSVLRTDDGDSIMSGITAVFGGEVGSIGDFVSVNVSFNLAVFFAFLLPLIFTLVFLVLTKNQKYSNSMRVLFNVLILVSFIYSLIVFLNLGMYTEGTTTIFGGTVTYSYEGARLGFGTILAIVFSIGGIITSGLNTFSLVSK